MGINRILVIKVRGLGDTLLATPALRALRAGLPQARITAVVSPAGLPALANNPDVIDIRVYDKKRHDPAYLIGFIRALRREHFELAMALHASFRTAFLVRASGSSRRVVHNHSGRNYFGTIPITAKKESKSAIERDLDAIRALGLEATDTHLSFNPTAADIAVAHEFLRAGRVRPPFFILAPGAGTARKRWTAAAGAQFLDHMAAAMPATWVLVAGPDDLELGRAIQNRAQGQTLIFNRTIQAAGALMSLSSGVVAMDSGPKHVAVAVGAPTLTLWTDEPVAEWHPYDMERHALVHSATGCVADISAAAAATAAEAHFRKFIGDLLQPQTR